MPRSFVVVVVAALWIPLCVSACPGRTVEAVRSEGRGNDDDDDGDEGDEGEGDAGEGEGEGATCSAATDKPVLGAGAVYFGTREPSHVVLDATQLRAVVGVGTGRPPGSECSGTLITDTVVLTATHCTEGTDATDFYVTFGVDDFDPELVVDVIEKSEHPDLDIAMLRLAFGPGTQLDVVPIPAFAGVLDEDDVGELFEQAGFGQTESGDSDGRFFVAEPFDGFEEPGGYLVVDGQGQHGVCFGDSGGPSLRQTVDSGVRVVGALSYGDPSCRDRDRYTRVDLVRDWLEDFAGTIPGAGPVPCGDVDSAGVCSPDGRVARFCDGGVLVRDPCEAGTICSEGDANKRCVAVDDNACGDVSFFGACDGDVVSWCDAGFEGGVVRVRDCGACGGEVCALVDNVTGFACVRDGCGGLTFTGECVGDVARYCSDNEVQEVDCGADGGTCGFIDDETGFFCE